MASYKFAEINSLTGLPNDWEKLIDSEKCLFASISSENKAAVQNWMDTHNLMYDDIGKKFTEKLSEIRRNPKNLGKTSNNSQGPNPTSFDINTSFLRSSESPNPTILSFSKPPIQPSNLHMGGFPTSSPSFNSTSTTSSSMPLNLEQIIQNLQVPALHPNIPPGQPIILKGGVPHLAPVNNLDQAMITRQGEGFDILYNKLTYRDKKEIRERVLAGGENFFSEYPIAPPMKNSRIDKQGFQLQQEAILLAQEANLALRALDAQNPDQDVVRSYLDNIITTASGLGTRGTFQRLYVRHPQVAKVLKYSNEACVLTPAMQEEFNMVKKNYPNSFFANTNNGFSRYRYNNNNRFNRNNRNNGYGRQSYSYNGNNNNRGYNNNNYRSSSYSSSSSSGQGGGGGQSDYQKGYQAAKNQFFQDGGENHRPTLSPKRITASLAKEATQREGQIPILETEEEVIREDLQGPWYAICTERGQIIEIPESLEPYWGILSGLLWYYAQLHLLSGGTEFLEEEEKIFGIPQYTSSPKDLRRDVSRVDQPENGRSSEIRGSHMGKSYSSSSKVKWKNETGGKYNESEQIHASNAFQNGRSTDLSSVVGKERLRSFFRSEGSIQSRPSTSYHATFIGSGLAWPMLQVRRNAFWPQRRTKGIFAYNASSSVDDSSILEHKGGSLPRRHHSASPKSHSPEEDGPRDKTVSAISRLDCERRKESSRAESDLQVLRLGLELAKSVPTVNQGTKIKSIKYSKGNKSSNPKKKENDHEVSSQSNWHLECSSTAIPPSQSLSGKTSSLQRRSRKKHGMEREDISQLCLTSGNPSMDSYNQGQLSSISTTFQSTPSSNYHGCSPPRLGGVSNLLSSGYGCNSYISLPTIIQQHELEYLRDQNLILLQNQSQLASRQNELTSLLSQQESECRNLRSSFSRLWCVEKRNADSNIQPPRAGGGAQSNSLLLPEANGATSGFNPDLLGQFSNSIQHQPKGSPSASCDESQKTPTVHGVTEANASRIPHSGGCEQNGGCIEPPRDLGGLPVKSYCPSQEVNGLKLPSGRGLVRDTGEQAVPSLLRSTSPTIPGEPRIPRKRPKHRVARSTSSYSPSDSSHSESAEQSDSGQAFRKRSRYSGLGGTDVDTDSSKSSDSKNQSRTVQENSMS
jgi:hypothetical protein